MNFKKRIDKEIEEIEKMNISTGWKEEDIYKLKTFRDFIEENPDLENEENYETLRDFFIYNPLDSQNPACEFIEEENQYDNRNGVIDYPRLEQYLELLIEKQYMEKDFDWERIQEYTSTLAEAHGNEETYYKADFMYEDFEIMDWKELQDWKVEFFESYKEELIEELGLDVEEKNKEQVMSV
ncbi:hypothetical protein [Mycoplasma sp. 392]